MQARAVNFTADAEEDLLDIWVYIGERNPAAADSMLHRLYDAANLLGEFPAMGIRRPSLGKDIRTVEVPPYLLIYTLQTSDVRIIRVLHKARDIKKLI